MYTNEIKRNVLHTKTNGFVIFLKPFDRLVVVIVQIAQYGTWVYKYCGFVLIKNSHFQSFKHETDQVEQLYRYIDFGVKCTLVSANYF